MSYADENRLASNTIALGLRCLGHVQIVDDVAVGRSPQTLIGPSCTGVLISLRTCVLTRCPRTSEWS